MKKLTDADRSQWRTIWCILRVLDWHEIESRGVLDYQLDWLRFNSDPQEFLVRANDAQASIIWAAVEKRMK